jgi:hypothetical protein
MWSITRSPRSLKMLVLLAVLAGVLGFAGPGCFHGEGAADLSPEAQAKAKESFKKRFGDYGIKAKASKASR